MERGFLPRPVVTGQRIKALKGIRFRLDIRNLYTEGGEALAQSSCGCPLPGSVQGQAGQGSEQPGLVEGVPAHDRGVGVGDLQRSLAM